MILVPHVVPWGYGLKKKERALYEKAKRYPQSITFKELLQLAVVAGFEFDSQDGTSHHQYKRKDDPYGFMNFQPLPSDKRMAKVYQVRQLVNFIDTNSLFNEDKKWDTNIL